MGILKYTHTYLLSMNDEIFNERKLIDRSSLLDEEKEKIVQELDLQERINKACNADKSHTEFFSC